VCVCDVGRGGLVCGAAAEAAWMRWVYVLSCVCVCVCACVCVCVCVMLAVAAWCAARLPKLHGCVECM